MNNKNIFYYHLIIIVIYLGRCENQLEIKQINHRSDYKENINELHRSHLAWLNPDLQEAQTDVKYNIPIRGDSCPAIKVSYPTGHLAAIRDIEGFCDIIVLSDDWRTEYYMPFKKIETQNEQGKKTYVSYDIVVFENRDILITRYKYNYVISCGIIYTDECDIYYENRVLIETLLNIDNTGLINADTSEYILPDTSHVYS